MKAMTLLYPRVCTEAQEPYLERAVERIMHHVLPPQFFGEEDVRERLSDRLPIVCWSCLAKPPFELSFFVWCPFREGAFRFFCEMVSRWLVPGRRLNATMQFAADFSLPEIGPEKYIAGEVRVRVETAAELELLHKHLPLFEAEVRLGLQSYYQACRIMEMKGLTSDEKATLIQENIVALTKHRPQDFDYDILLEVQRFLVLCREEFKAARSWRHMSRIICVHYLFRKALKFSLDVYPERRYINVKLVRAQLSSKKKVVGVNIGMSYLKEHERFEAHHILSGIQAVVAKAQIVAGSFFSSQNQAGDAVTLYLEIEKEDGASVTLEEERQLKEALPSELKSRIEQRLNPIFMPQNEETLLRHIVTLSAELKDEKDLPQVIIDFAKQTEDKLEFIVVALRVALPRLKSISACFEKKTTFLGYIPDRVNSIGWPRRKYTKQAAVFRLQIDKKPFLRKDHSVDLLQARARVAEELSRVMGEYRDYNGGTIAKENEVFQQLQKSAGDSPFLLENYFYSLSPPIMRSLLPASPLQKLFNMILESESDPIGSDSPYQIRIDDDSDYLYLLVNSGKCALLQEQLLPRLKPYTGRVATCLLHETTSPAFGLIFRSPDDEESLRLRLLLEQLLFEL